MIQIEFDAVLKLASVGSLIEPLRRAFSSPAHCPTRVHHELKGEGATRTLLLMPAWRPNGAMGVKIVTVFPDNAVRGLPSVNAAYLLISGDTGETLAWIDGRALTLIRTAAVSALAADLLAPARPQVLLMVGTGALSRYLIEGHLAVRRYQSVLIWGRDSAKSAAVAQDLCARGWPVSVAADLESAARSADVLSCATLAEMPLIAGAWLKADSHLDLVGSYRPPMREADDECMRGADIVVDTREALVDSGDLSGPLSRGVIHSGDIRVLSDFAARREPPARAHRTVFKTVGVALADLAVAQQLYERRLK